MPSVPHVLGHAQPRIKCPDTYTSLAPPPAAAAPSSVSDSSDSSDATVTLGSPAGVGQPTGTRPAGIGRVRTRPFGTAICLHTGHVSLFSSHFSAQQRWNQCLQRVRRAAGLSAEALSRATVIPVRQMGQSSGSSSTATGSYTSASAVHLSRSCCWRNRDSRRHSQGGTIARGADGALNMDMVHVSSEADLLCRWHKPGTQAQHDSHTSMRHHCAGRVRADRALGGPAVDATGRGGRAPAAGLGAPAGPRGAPGRTVGHRASDLAAP